MASNHQKTIDQQRHTWCSAKIRKGTSPPWVESAINDANCAWKKAKVQGNMVVDQSEHNLRWKGSFYPPPNIRKKKGVRNWMDQNSKWYIRTQNNITYAKLLFPTLPWHLLHLHWTLESSLWAGEGIREKRSSWSVYQISLTDFENFWKRLWKVTINLIYSIKIYFLWH